MDGALSSITAAGKQNIGNAASSGQNAISSFDPSSISASNANQQGSLYGPGGSQSGQMNDYMAAYKASIANNPTATQLYDTANQQFNVPTLQNNATNLNNAVLTAPQQTLDTARGFNYDNNQVGNQTNLTLGRLSPLAIAATNSANTAEGLASNYVNAGLSQNATNLMPIQSYGQQLGAQLGYQATGLDQNQTNTLSALVSKMQSGEQLSAQEMQSYEQLAAAEEGAQATETSAQTTANAAQNVAKINSQNQILPTANGGATYYNPVTGYAYNPFSNIRQPS